MCVCVCQVFLLGIFKDKVVKGKKKMKFAFLYIFGYDRLKARQVCRVCLIPHQGGNLGGFDVVWSPGP